MSVWSVLWTADFEGRFSFQPQGDRLTDFVARMLSWVDRDVILFQKTSPSCPHCTTGRKYSGKYRIRWRDKERLVKFTIGLLWDIELRRSLHTRNINISAGRATALALWMLNTTIVRTLTKVGSPFIAVN
jgi:hypothetical protein